MTAPQLHIDRLADGGIRVTFHGSTEDDEQRVNEVAKQATRYLRGRIDVRSYLAGIATAALVGTIAVLLALGGAPRVAAHDITPAPVVDCTSQTITVKGVGFDPATNSPITVTGPGGYSQTFPVTTADWTKVLPVGQPGVYTIDWPNSNGHSVTFTASCQRSEPTPTPVVTPTPAPTPSPTPTPKFSPTPNPTLSPAPTPTATVAAATGTPKPHVTLPPTDTE